MILIWRGNVPYADVEMVANLYEVSTRTVRRHCTPVEYAPRAGQQRGVGGRALYDALAAGTALADVSPRPERTLAALRYRAAHHDTEDP